MAVTARYNNGFVLSYCLIAYSPREELRVIITGTKGHIEMDIEETVSHLLGNGQVSARKGPFKQVRIAMTQFGLQPHLDALLAKRPCLRPQLAIHSSAHVDHLPSVHARFNRWLAD